MKDVGIVVGPATYQLAAKSFRDVGTNNGHRGSISFADYARQHTAGFWTNNRLPDAANNIQQAYPAPAWAGRASARRSVRIGARCRLTMFTAGARAGPGTCRFTSCWATCW